MHGTPFTIGNWISTAIKLRQSISPALAGVSERFRGIRPGKLAASTLPLGAIFLNITNHRPRFLRNATWNPPAEFRGVSKDIPLTTIMDEYGG